MTATEKLEKEFEKTIELKLRPTMLIPECFSDLYLATVQKLNNKYGDRDRCIAPLFIRCSEYGDELVYNKNKVKR